MLDFQYLDFPIEKKLFQIENISAEPSDSETSMKPKLEINGHCSPLIKSENEQKPTTSGVDVVKYEPTECSTDRPLGKIKKQVALEKVSSDDTDGDLISFVSTDDSQRRSLRLSRFGDLFFLTYSD